MRFSTWVLCRWLLSPHVTLTDIRIYVYRVWISSFYTSPISLEGVTTSKINGASLSKLLRNYRDSLSVLNITWITLESSGWKSILQMLSEFPLLKSFSFNSLREARCDIQFPIASEIPTVDEGTEFTFRPRKRKDRMFNTRVSCRGPNTKAIIQRLADSMEIVC